MKWIYFSLGGFLVFITWATPKTPAAAWNNNLVISIGSKIYTAIGTKANQVEAHIRITPREHALDFQNGFIDALNPKLNTIGKPDFFNNFWK